MTVRHFILLLLFFLLQTAARGQYATNFTINDGLPTNHIYKITQDNEGFIWVITDNGILKYNGNHFKLFTTKEGLPTNDIWEIEITPDGKVWFFCKASKIGYIDNDKVYSFGGVETEEVFFPLRIVEYENQILFESTEDWYFLNEDHKWQGVNTVKNHPVKYIYQKIDSIVKSEGANNIYHLRSKDNHVFWLERDNYFIFNTKTNKIIDGKKDYGFNRRFSTFARVNFIHGNLQITDKNYGVQLDSNFEITKEFSTPQDFSVHHIILDRTDNLWGASLQKGFYKIPSVYQKFQYFFPSEKIESIEKVGENIIVNVFDKGYLKYNKATLKFTPFIEKPGVLNPLSIIESQEKLYFIHQLEMTIFDFMSETPITKRELTEGIKQIVHKEGYLYGSGSFAVKKMDASTLEVIDRYDAVGMNKLFNFNNTILVGTTDGLKYLKEEKVQPFTGDSLFHKSVSNIVSLDKERFLVCTEGYGAYATNTTKITPFPNTQFLNVDDAFVQGNSVWLATNEGLFEYEKNGNSFQFKNNVTEELGIASRRVNTVLVEDETIFIGTDSGLIVFPKDLSAPSQFLNIYVDAIHFNDTPLTTTDNTIDYEPKNSLRVQLGAINFSEKNTPIPYRYKLEPIQDFWQKTTSATLNFNDLPPNDYRLSIEAEDKKTSFNFSVLPLWWQTLTAKILFALLALGVIIFVLQTIRRMELQKKTAKLNAQKKLAVYELYALRSQMNPHFVFNSLTAIQYYINENDFENSEKYLVKFSKLIRQFFEIAKEEEITLENEITLLKSYLEIEKLRFKEKLNFTIEVDPELNVSQQKIPTMLLQPVVENAVNHGIFNKEGDGAITLSFKYINPKEFSVEILDDGVGFAKTKKQRNGKISSSVILKDRISILNQSRNWDIAYNTVVAFSEASDKGNKATFKIKNLQ